MKNLKFLAILIGIVTIAYTGCKKETVVEPEKPKGISVNYTVNVTSAANAVNARVGSLSDVEVTLVQNGTKTSKTTKDDGFAMFTDLRAGDVAVTVKKSGFTSISFVANLDIADTLSDAVDFRYASSLVILYPTTGAGTATISGKVTANLDNRSVSSPGGFEEDVVGKKIFFSIDINNSNFVSHQGAGKITQVVVDEAVVSATTGSDGSYSVTVPASGTGVALTMTGDDFRSNKIFAVTPATNPPTTFTVPTVYSTNSVNMKVTSGGNYILDIFYQ